MPASDGLTVAERPQRTYTYGPSSTSYLDAGLPAPDGHHGQARFDELLRATAATSAMGLTGRTIGHPSKDLQIAAVDPTGLATATESDINERSPTVKG